MISARNGMRSVVAATAIAIFIAGQVSAAQAAVSEQKAKELGNNLTKFGAEKGGSKDGSIPPYTGGLRNVKGYDQKMAKYKNPYADEKPLYIVTQANMDKYKSLLTKGELALLKKYPTYQMPVYKTHRSDWYPDWVLQNTVKNATTAKLAGEVEGDAIKGAGPNGYPYAGIPFPIPQNGYQVMWNHQMAYMPPVQHVKSGGLLVGSGGGVAKMPRPDLYVFKPEYEKGGELSQRIGYDIYRGFEAVDTFPPDLAGVGYLIFYNKSASNGGQEAWFYTPGQRRSRRAPNFAYDLPLSAYSGMYIWDETYGFVGRMNRFKFKLLGKEAKLIPYNSFQMWTTMDPPPLGAHHLKPAGQRFEEHRVWVVQATLKPGERHIYQKRVYYIDEDSWNVSAFESYDSSGKLVQVGYVHIFPTYDTGGINDSTWTFYSLDTGRYVNINTGWRADTSFHSYTDPDKISNLHFPLTASAMETQGIR